MAISAQILDAQNGCFFILFQRMLVAWYPSFGLKWTELFIPGVDVTINELPIILEELDQLKKWVYLNLCGIKKEHFFERVGPLVEGLPLISILKATKDPAGSF